MEVDKPQLLNITAIDDGFLLSLFVCADIKYFKGHFDDSPVLPGVVQLDWAINFAQQYLGMPSVVDSVEVLKFQKLLLPESKVFLSLKRKADNKFVFKFYHDDAVYSSGRVVME